MNWRFLVAALCVLTPLSCLGQNVNGEATYVSFAIPGALGTYPMSINSSMTVTGYYYVSSTQIRGFVREADGTISNFNVDGTGWTVPESINAAGDITGFYELTADVPQGFIRYADGRIVTFNLPAAFPQNPPEALPVSINDFDEIAGDYPFPLATTSIFTRSRQGDFTTFYFTQGAAYGNVATAINRSGAVVGYSQKGNGDKVGFLRDADGFSTEITIPAPPPLPHAPYCASRTVPEGLNAEGTIAGWYSTGSGSGCATSIQGGFVVSPNGVYTLFSAPGPLVTPLLPDVFMVQQPQLLIIPHCMSIDQAGDVAGSYTDATGAQHGFVRSPYGTITSFDPPKGNQTTSTGINDGGAITGFYYYSAAAGPPVGFIRVP